MKNFAINSFDAFDGKSEKARSSFKQFTEMGKLVENDKKEKGRLNITDNRNSFLHSNFSKIPSVEEATKKEKKRSEAIAPDKRIGYAVVGLGKLTQLQILPAFGKCKKSKLVALVSGDPDKSKKLAEQYGVKKTNIYNYQNYDELRNNPEVDVIYIVLPNGMHAEYTIRGAKAGKHILCEKPMANSVKEGLEMIDACRKADRKLMLAYRIQYEPYNNHIKTLCRENEFGATKMITSSNNQNIPDPKVWRLNKKLAGGGCLPDIGIYCLNTIRFITGEEPYEVYANTYSTPGDPRWKEVEESITWQMKFPSGILATCTSSYGVFESRNYRVFAEDGYFGMDPAYPYYGLRLYKSFLSEGMEITQDVYLDEQDHFATEMDHLSECIIENKDPYTPGEEGLQDMKIIEALYKSAEKNKPVQLERIQELDVFRNVGSVISSDKKS